MRAKRVDSNQAEIVRQLRQIPGVTVALDHDDILVGRFGKTFWYEIKNPLTLKKNGEFKKGTKRKSQKRIERTFTGHYKFVTCIDEILIDMGVIQKSPN